MKKSIKSLSFTIIIVGIFCTACLLTVLFGVLNPIGTAYAVYYNDTTYENFLRYSGSSHNFGAKVTYPSSVTSSMDAEMFTIKCITTEIEWSIFGPGFNNVKITLIRPDGSSRVYSFPNKSYIKEHFSYTIFSADDLKKENGEVIEGQYTVQASGIIYAGNNQSQTNSFSFYVNLNAPTLNLNVGSSLLSSFDITRSNVTVTASDTYGVPTLQYDHSTEDVFPSFASQNISSGTTFSEEGRYLVKATDNFGRETIKYFIIDKTAPTLSLSGVTNGGISNGTVTASWSTSIGGVGAQRVYSSDLLTVKYSLSETNEFPTSATVDYTSGTSLSQEGNYLMTITDKAGNSTSYTFTIDKTAPTLTLSGVTNGGFTNGTIRVTWGTEIGGVGAQLTNNKDDLTVKYSRSTGSTFPTSATTSYTSGTSLTEEGNYLMTITDKAGNSTSYTFTIDKTAPTLTLSGIVVGQMAKDSVSATWVTTVEGAGKNLTNSNDVLTVKYSVQSDTYPTTATTTYSRNTSLTAEGYYLMTITDKTGNVRKYQFLIDKTAPKVAAFDEFTNKTFVFSATDPRDITIEYRHDGGAVTSVQQASVEIVCNESNYGSWEFRAIDAVGNATGWNTINLYVRDTFGNQEEIKNAYKVPAWYTVRLTTKVFPDIAGTYSFASYESALDFAIKKEWEYRVVELSGGRWSYVNIANESVTQIYDDRATLDNAVLKYAKSYISDRYIFDVTGSTYPNPTDDEGTTRPDALTSQNLVLPEHLAQYADLPLYFIRHAYQFVAPAQGVKGNKTSVLVQFLSDGLTPQTGAEISVAYGQALKTALENAGAWRQGYYLVTERDLCGNIEQYIVCLDTELPTVTAKV